MKSADECDTMADVRDEIDAIDRALITLIGKRCTYIEAAARIKHTVDAVRDEARIKDVLDKTQAHAEKLAVPVDIITATMSTLVEASIAHEFKKFNEKHP